MPKVKVTAEYKGHPVITGDYRLFGYNERHLKNNLEMLESAVERHNKILSYRMDIRFPVNSEKIKIKKGGINNQSAIIDGECKQQDGFDQELIRN